MIPRENRSSILIVCAALVLGVWLGFGGARQNGFINFDDDLYIYQNPVVVRGLTLDGLVWAFTSVSASNWHPLTWLSHMMDCELFGLDAGAHHVTSVLLHAVSAVLCFLALRRLTQTFWRSAVVATVFALHPLRVESVVWASERKDVLSGLFFMFTLYAWAGYVRIRAREPLHGADVDSAASARRCYLLALGAYALGLMAKPMLVTLPCVLLLLDDWPFGRFVRSRARAVHLLAEKAPFFVLTAAACIVTIVAQQPALTPVPLTVRFANAVCAYVFYLGKSFWPTSLSVYYPHLGERLSIATVMVGSAALAAISVIAIANRKTRPWLLFGWLWYLGMLVPVIGLVQVGSQAQADRYTYLPQIGLVVALVWSAAECFIRWRVPRLAVAGAVTGVLIALLVGARAQTAVWRDNESLWSHALACTTNNVIAHDNLGSALLAEGRVAEAEKHFEAALSISPDHANARNNLGNVLLRRNEIDRAIGEFQRALAINPRHVEAQHNLGIALIRAGRSDEAVAAFEATLRLNPDYAFAHNSLGQALLDRGQAEQAIGHFERALALSPTYSEAHYNAGNACLALGRTMDAVRHYWQALALNPNYADARNNLGYVFLQLGNRVDAITCFERALQLDPTHTNAQFNLGTALLQEDRLAEAAEHFRAVLRLQPAAAPAANNLAFVLSRQGRLKEAAAQYANVLEQSPENLTALSNFAWILATCPADALRDGPRATELARKAAQLTGGQDPAILRALAAALAECKEFRGAAQVAAEATRLARAQEKADLAETLIAQSARYAASSPWRDASLAETEATP